MQTLAVTSPMTHGPHVTRAQQQLHGNPFKQNYMQGYDIDGWFGPQTGRACIRAKYWLGYPRGDQKPIYGDQLDSYLSGRVELPAEYAASRKARLAKAKNKPLREKALERALADVGMKEHPANSNRCEISVSWGLIGPWCAMATSTWYIKSGSLAFRHGRDYAYVPYVLSAAVSGARGLSLVKSTHVKPGDLVCFDWDRGGLADHIGLFHSWISVGRSFRTVEGNTAIGNDSNGGQVMRRERTLDQVARAGGQLGLVHVGR